MFWVSRLKRVYARRDALWRSTQPTICSSPLARYGILVPLLLARRVGAGWFRFHPGRGGGERRQALRVLRGTRFACHDRHAGACEAPCVPSDGDARLAALHRGDFWPGPVLAVVRHSLRDRAATLFAARVIVTRRSGSPGPPAAR